MIYATLAAAVVAVSLVSGEAEADAMQLTTRRLLGWDKSYDKGYDNKGYDNKGYDNKGYDSRGGRNDRYDSKDYRSGGWASNKRGYNYNNNKGPNYGGADKYDSRDKYDSGDKYDNGKGWASNYG